MVASERQDIYLAVRERKRHRHIICSPSSFELLDNRKVKLLMLRVQPLPNAAKPIGDDGDAMATFEKWIKLPSKYETE